MTRATQRATDPKASIETGSTAEALGVEVRTAEAPTDGPLATEVSADDESTKGGRYA